MKKNFWLIVLLFLFVFQLSAYAANYRDITLINKYRFEYNTYTKGNNTIDYYQKFMNESDINQEPSLILVLHSGSEKGTLGEALKFPAVKSLVDYSQKKHKKLLILVPQYPYIQGPYSNKLNKLMLYIVRQKITEYKIPLNKVYLTGASWGGQAGYKMLINGPIYFSNALFVSYISDFSVNIPSNTKIYHIIGDKDNVHKLKKCMNEIKKKYHVTPKYKILKNTDHIKAIKIAYTEESWDWLFNESFQARFEQFLRKNKYEIIGISFVFVFLLLLFVLYKVFHIIYKKDS